MGKISIAFHAAQQSMANHPDNIVYDQTYHVTSSSMWGDRNNRYDRHRGMFLLSIAANPATKKRKGHLVPSYLFRVQMLLLAKIKLKVSHLKSNKDL